MASTINASTTLGLISTADTSGVLQLQTANTAALTIDGSQNVGVGTSSPSASFKFDVTGLIRSNATANGGGQYTVSKNGTTVGGLCGSGNWIGSSATDLALFAETGNALSIFTNGSATARATFDTSGNLLVNTVSSTASTGQTAKLQVAGGIRTTTGFTSSISLGNIAQNATTTAAVGFNGFWLISNGGDSSALFLITLSGGGTKTQLIFSTGSDIVCGTTSEPSGGSYLRLWVSGGVLQVKNVNAYTGPWFLTPIATFAS